ncbi:MAG: Hint domain-containing protein [Pseudomonadota bacterium]
MPDYDIYVLEEDAISVSGGGQLDGQTQGDGSHLTGLTITLNTGGWQPVSVSDDDGNFQDNDNGQTLDGAVTLNGITHASGRIVEAEFSFTVTDGTFNPDGTPVTWTLIAFNVREAGSTQPSYATVEGIAFIGPPGGFPPVGTPLTVTGAAEGPSFPVSDYATPICMAEGTLVLTPHGNRPVEEICVGERVMTRDHGVQEVLWHGARLGLHGAGFAPVCFAPGVLGNVRPLILSQQHRVLVSGWQAQLHFGTDDMLVPAVHLVDGRAVTVLRETRVRYHHLLLSDHAMLRTEGAWTESFHPGAEALKGLRTGAREELVALFPDLTHGSERPLSYPVARRAETELLRAG